MQFAASIAVPTGRPAPDRHLTETGLNPQALQQLVDTRYELLTSCAQHKCRCQMPSQPVLKDVDAGLIPATSSSARAARRQGFAVAGQEGGECGLRAVQEVISHAPPVPDGGVNALSGLRACFFHPSVVAYAAFHHSSHVLMYAPEDSLSCRLEATRMI